MRLKETETKQETAARKKWRKETVRGYQSPENKEITFFCKKIPTNRKGVPTNRKGGPCFREHNSRGYRSPENREITVFFLQKNPNKQEKESSNRKRRSNKKEVHAIENTTVLSTWVLRGAALQSKSPKR